MMAVFGSTPMTKLGRIAFGILAGILVMSIRLFSMMPEGVAVSIVLLNTLTPLLDKLGIYFHLKLYEILFPEVAP